MVMMHKSFTQPPIYDLRATINLFKRAAAISWRELLTASIEEVAAELEWARTRPRSTFNTEVQTAVGQAMPPVEQSYTSNEFWNALRRDEQKNIDGCLGIDTRCIIMANQCLEDGWKIMSSRTVLHTLVHNAAVHWIHGVSGELVGEPNLGGRLQPCDRWMTSSEHLLSMGFPFHVSLSGGVQCFHITSVDALLSRKRQNVVAQAGNSMNTCVAYAILSFVFSCVETVQELAQ